MNRTLFCTGILILSVFFLSFKKDDNIRNVPKSYRDKLAYIPMTSVEMEGTLISVGDFFLATTEVSNLEYRTFLEEKKLEGKVDIWQMSLVDTANWVESLRYGEPYKVYYHKHPAYDHYPVVNVSYEGASAYCDWLETKMNGISENDVTYEVRLPSREEWVRSANGNMSVPQYSWGGPSLQNARGISLCNYRKIGDAGISYNEGTGKYEVMEGTTDVMMGVAGHVSNNADITTPVHAYSPSEFGLYNMNGNVAEMVFEKGMAVGGSWRSPGYDVRNQSWIKYDTATPVIGFRPLVVKVE